MSRKGFTLIELLIVVAIISILAGIVLVGLRPSLNTSRDARRAAELRQIQTGLQLYYNRYGSYPSALSDLSNVSVTVPNDPGGAPYYYSQSAGTYFLGAKLEEDRASSLEAGNASSGTGLSNGVDTLDCSSPKAYCLSF